MLLNRLVLILIFLIVLLFATSSIGDIFPALQNLKEMISKNFSLFFNWGQDLFHKGTLSIQNTALWFKDTATETFDTATLTINTYWNETKEVIDKILRILVIVKE